MRAVLTALVILLTTALATGSAIFLSAAILLALLALTAWLSVWQAARTLLIDCELESQAIPRGTDAELVVVVEHQGVLPIAPVTLRLRSTPDAPIAEVRLKDMPGKQQRLRLPFHAAHVGVCLPGVESVTVADLFGLYSVTRMPEHVQHPLVVLPTLFPTEALAFAPGDSGLETVARATEDVTSPADVRAYQPGDSMKKIHWKLSARKQELLVRRFEEPELPDALVLLDCSRPPTWGHPEAEADVKDALLETAASVVSEQMTGDHAVRMPLLGSHPVECEKRMGLPAILECLARLDFSETDRFERVLHMETRRIRKVGSTVVVAARLNGHMVDAMRRMRKMGPYVRLYLITFTPDDPAVLPMVSKLQQGDVEVRYVRPVPM